MYNFLKFLVILYCTVFGSLVQARLLNIVVTIKPYYNLLLAVTNGVQKPQLLISGNNSPHDYLLTPNDLIALQNADLIIWGGREVEKYFSVHPVNKDLVDFFNKRVAYFETLNDPANIINLSKINGLKLLKYRNDPVHIDPHLWLSPDNAKAIVIHLNNVLQNLDPKNADKYAKNTDIFLEKLYIMNNSLQKIKLRIRNNYLVFHDAYQYLEYYFSIPRPYILHTHPELPLPAKKVQAIEEFLQQSKICCVFTEPQFSGKMLRNWIQKYGVLHGTLDPLGQDQDIGINGYFTLITNIITTIAEITQKCPEDS